MVKVLDFGVAAFLSPDFVKLTTTGEQVGSLECMAPEQIKGKQVDHRTDLYALGCLLHKMLTGEPVFAHDSDLMLPGLILDRPPTPLRELRPEIPGDLEELILQLLSKDPRARPLTRVKCGSGLPAGFPNVAIPQLPSPRGRRWTPCAPSPTPWARRPARTRVGEAGPGELSNQRTCSDQAERHSGARAGATQHDRSRSRNAWVSSRAAAVCCRIPRSPRLAAALLDPSFH